jgi:hypothetical protein
LSGWLHRTAQNNCLPLTRMISGIILPLTSMPRWVN